MFFKLHSERKIGIKLLSDADLGLGNSHQTHIGLFDGIFTFLSDREEVKSALLIYNDKVNIIDCYFDRIQNPDETFRSPKIKKGGYNTVSIVTIIRDKVKEYPDYRWYLIWFALDGEELVFYFFNDHSEDFKEISSIIDIEQKKKIKVDDENNNLNKFLQYLENKINIYGENIIEKVEIDSQINISKEYKIFNLENIKRKRNILGRVGESIVNEYFSLLQSKRKITTFNWCNKSYESGLPYDFTLQYNNDQIIYLDVKSTSLSFEKPMIFSSQEIECITNTTNYHIYRLYGVDNSESPSKLRICKNSKYLANEILKNINSFRTELSINDVILDSSKLGIYPNNKYLNFEKEIILPLTS